jgi:hypothetical protein
LFKNRDPVEWEYTYKFIAPIIVGCCNGVGWWLWLWWGWSGWHVEISHHARRESIVIMAYNTFLLNIFWHGSMVFQLELLKKKTPSIDFSENNYWNKPTVGQIPISFIELEISIQKKPRMKYIAITSSEILKLFKDQYDLPEIFKSWKKAQSTHEDLDSIILEVSLIHPRVLTQCKKYSWFQDQSVYISMYK